MKNLYLGIDLGTTYSAAAYISDGGEPSIATNSMGRNTTPSVVYFETEDSVIVGETAKENDCIHPDQVVSLVKNYMGKLNPDGSPVKMHTKFGDYMPDVISAHILKSLVRDAESLLAPGQQIQNVVVTIPAKFKDAPRKATENAISIAGLNQLGIINEPTAAALFYIEKEKLRDANILVYDLGGGTFDVSVIHVDDKGNTEVLATDGLPEVGGSSFDKELVQRICMDFNEKHGIELLDAGYSDVLQELYIKAERAKIQLSTATSANISVRADGCVENYTITREHINDIVGRLYQKTEAKMRQVIKMAELTNDDIDRIVLVGGSSRIPYVYEHIRDYFGKEPSRDVNPDEVVALGAAIFAKQCADGSQKRISDVNSHSIGIRAQDPKTGTQFNDILIKRNTRLPASVEREYVYRSKDQASLFINVFEGEYKELSDVTELCAVDIDLPKNTKDNTKVVIRLEIDQFQLLHIYIRLPEAGNVETELSFDRRSNMSEAEVSEWKKSIARPKPTIIGTSDSKTEEKSEPKKKGFFANFGKKKDKDGEDTEAEKDSVKADDSDLILPDASLAKKKEEKQEKKYPKEIELAMAGAAGFEELKEGLVTYKNRYTLSVKKEKPEDKCLAILGEHGMGVTEAAQRAAIALHNLGIVGNDTVVTAGIEDIVKLDAEGSAGAIKTLFEKAMGGVLIIDDFHKFYNESEDAISMKVTEALVNAYHDCERKVTIIIAGRGHEIRKIMEARPRFHRLFMASMIDLVGYSASEYVEMIHFAAENMGYVIDDRADKFLERHFKAMLKMDDFGGVYYIYEVLNAAITDLSEKVAADRRAKSVDLAIIRKENFAVLEGDKNLDELLAEFNALIGLGSVKKQLKVVMDNVEAQKLAEEKNIRLPGTEGASRHMIFQGPPGTGKTETARLIAGIFREMGVLSKGQLVEVSRSELIGRHMGDTARNVTEAVDSAMGGVLFIDEIYSLYNGDGDVYGKEAIDTLNKLLEDRREGFICIIAGYTEQVQEFLRTNPGLKDRFQENYVFTYENYTLDELYQIFELFRSKDGCLIEAKALEAVKEGIAAKAKQPNFGNGRAVRSIYKQIMERHTSRWMNLPDKDGNEEKIIRLADVPESFIEETLSIDEIMAEIDKLIGLGNVKKQLRALAHQARLFEDQKAAGVASDTTMDLHLAFVGNPGTGKTTVAELVAKIYKSVGALPTSNLVKTERANLVGDAVGKAEENTKNRILDAMGGVLFIDEAHQLADGEGYGSKAIQTLIKALEEHRGDFSCIVAGYPKEMQKFFDTDPGLKRRFHHIIEFEDYTLDELTEIFESMLKSKGYFYTNEVVAKARKILEIKKAMPNFGNAGEVRNIISDAIGNLAVRLSIVPSEEKTPELMKTLIPEDFDGIENLGEELRVEDLLAELDAMIGLGSVKQQVRNQINRVKVNKWNEEAGLVSDEPETLHMVFSGPPGTGKTTVAEKIGKIYKALGIIPSGHTVVAKREDLVAGYIGQTADKTAEKIKEAMGGVLFIDEAYGLIPGSEQDFGGEAITTLVNWLDRPEFRNSSVCIVAGYRDEMDKLLQYNVGLLSRFKNYIEFEDYTTEELYEIFLSKVKGKILEDGVRERVLEIIRDEKARQGAAFANGRGARNVAQRIIGNMNNRLARYDTRPSDEALRTIRLEDCY